MAEFNYTDIHIFNKAGEELPISINSAIEIKISNKYGDPAIFYPVIDKTGSVLSYYKKSSGSRFSNEDSSLNCTINGEAGVASVEFSSQEYVNSNNESEYIIKKLTSIEPELPNIEYPSIKLNSVININTVSTGLIETESLYVLGWNGSQYTTLNDISEDWSNRYEILFYLDNKNQKDFRFFTLENNELVWSNKSILNFKSDEEDSYRVNIGFCSEEEGVFEEPIRIFLLDRGIGKTLSLEECDIVEIGTILLKAETIGEDERYRTLFANFGIPDPKTYNKLFANTPTEEDNIDNILLNQNSKALFLSYSEIFPYAGTYKALINAVNLLGYKDLYFKEWYKRIGTNTNNNYVSYNMSYASNARDNIINNTSIEERIHLKKLNWLSMMYKLNEELFDTPEDRFGFPIVSNKYSFNNAELVAKLIALREWLQKYIVGLNCRIIEVSGEGVYFERYRNNTYGTFQSSFEWNNEKFISPEIINDTDTVLDDYTASIKVSVDPKDYNNTLEDIKDFRFSDFCEGYFDENSQYHNYTSNVDDSSLFIGKTLYAYNDLEEYKLKASISCESFLFNEDFVDSSSCSLRIYDNALYVNPADIAAGLSESCIFTNLPIIYIKSCKFRPIDNIDSEEFISVENNDFISIRGLNNAEFSYREEKKYGLPVFIVKNYDVNKLDSSLNNSSEYILDIIEGKLMFEIDSDTYKQITVNFDYTNNSYDKNITVNIVSFSNFFRVKSYGDNKRFIPNTSYANFISDYFSNPEESISYDFEMQIPVNHAGEYKIDVYGVDEYNNIFAAACKNTVNITTPKYFSNAYATSKSSEDAVEIGNEDRDLLLTNYDAYCIYNKERTFLFDRTIEDDKLAIDYKTYTYSQPTPSKGDYVHLSNKFEKFKCLNVKTFDEGATTARYINKDGTAQYQVYKSYDMTVEKEYTNNIYDYVTDPSADSDEVFGDDNPTYVNAVFYNELGGYPIYQTYAKLISDIEDPSVFHLNITDDTVKSYIWACAEEPHLVKSIVTDNFIAQSTENEFEFRDDIENYDTVSEELFRKCANYILRDYKIVYENRNAVITGGANPFSATIETEQIKSFIVDSYIDTDETAKTSFVDFVKQPYPSSQKDTSVNWNYGWEDDNFAKANDIYSRILNGYKTSIQTDCPELIAYTLEYTLLQVVFNTVSDFILQREDASTNTNILKNMLIASFEEGGSVFSDDISTDLLYGSIEGQTYENAITSLTDTAITFINTKFVDVVNKEKDYSDSLFAIYSCIAYCVYAYLISETTITSKPYIIEYFKEYIIGTTLLNNFANYCSEIIITENSRDIEVNGVSTGQSRDTSSLSSYIKGNVYEYSHPDNRLNNWITRFVLSPGAPTDLNQRTFNDYTYYYAVAYVRDSKAYYLKPREEMLNGYANVTPELPENFTMDLSKLMDYPGVGLYIEPLHKAVISIAAGEEEGTLEIIPSVSTYYDMKMYKGDVLKIYIKNVINDSYIGQASYIVKDVKDDEYSSYIVEGVINDQYIRGEGNNVLVKMEEGSTYNIDEIGNLDYSEITVNGITYIPDSASFKKKITYEDSSGNRDSGEAFSYMIDKEIDGINLKDTNIRVWFAKIVNKDTDETELYYVALETLKRGEEYLGSSPIKYYTKNISENIIMYMSYAHWAYADYVLTADKISFDNANNIINFENTTDNKKLLTFADSKFLVSVRNFNINEGIKQWMDFSDDDLEIDDPLKGSPKILDYTTIYKYDTENPVVSREEPYLVIMPKDLPEDCYVYWRIYKQISISEENKYLFESYNEVLYLDSNDPGIYDVEMIVYDKYGNISRNMIKGAYTVI